MWYKIYEALLVEHDISSAQTEQIMILFSMGFSVYEFPQTAYGVEAEFCVQKNVNQVYNYSDTAKGVRMIYLFI